MNISIVGASRGLGRELCRRLVAEGHTVWGVARSAEELQETAKVCSGGIFQYTCVDITDAKSLQNWEHELSATSFVPDIVVLNASIQLDDMHQHYDYEKSVQVLRTNLEGSLACVSLFLPDFLAHKHGRFVAIASTAALRPSSRSASYAAAKAGIVMAFRSLRLHYGQSGVSFATVMLGPIHTAMWEGKKSAIVPSAEQAAAALARAICSTRSVIYYPRLSTWLLRLSLFLPDRLFASASSSFLK